MGIERVLREKFENLGEVVDVGSVEEGAAPASGLTVDLVYGKLEQIMPAILGMGGSIRVVSAEGGVATLEYTGPEKIKFGIELALKDEPLVETVVFV